MTEVDIDATTALVTCATTTTACDVIQRRVVLIEYILVSPNQTLNEVTMIGGQTMRYANVIILT